LKTDKAGSNQTSPQIADDHRRQSDVVNVQRTPLQGPALASLIGDTLDISVVGMMILDADMRVVWVNRTLEDYFGLQRMDLIGRDHHRLVDETLKHIFDDPDHFYRNVSATNQDRSIIQSFECRIRPDRIRRDRWLEYRSQPIHNGFFAGGRIEHYTDISNRRRAANTAKNLSRQLINAQRMESIGILAGGVAHDFNNILQAISGYAQLLLMDKNADHPEAPMILEIERAARRASELTHQLLTFSRRVESALTPADLNANVRHVKKLLERTIPKMIRIELSLDEALWPVKADAGQIEQVLMNIGINARQAMPEGGRLEFQTVNVVLTPEDAQSLGELSAGPYVKLSIADTGQGIEPECLEFIFDPFFTTREVGQGTGLGLSMAYGIIKNHNGFITCRSKSGLGTTFDIYLPALLAEEACPNDCEIDEDALCKGSESVLVVDDDESVLNLACSILRRYGYRTQTALDGESAVEAYRSESGRFDLVILDLNMPGMGGHKCLEELKRLDADLRVIIASGYPSDEETQEILQDLRGGFVAKPYRIDALIGQVRTVLDLA
jgi:PAS domain S-box-containing protein